ncbi:MAG: prealbumin-like fold domain-containing protein [Peptostreptococcaceae bacterium]|nr:prealbumin-like fold domain-containing protein [Peptostreptococcaceae bacterium]
MTKVKKHRAISWIMSLVLVLNVFLVPTWSYADVLDNNKVITVSEHSVLQGGNEVKPNEQIVFGQDIDINSKLTVKLVDTTTTPAELLVKKGDQLVFPIHKNLELVRVPLPKPVVHDGVEIGELRYENHATEGARAIIEFTLDQSSTAPNDLYTETTIEMGASYRLNGIEEPSTPSGTEFVLFEQKYTIVPPKAEIDYTIAKKGEVDFKNQMINWTVNVSATNKKTNDPASLEKATFEDLLNIAEIGEYVPGSFTVGGAAVVPDYTSPKLSYQFPDNAPSETEITFKTSIPDDVFFGQTETPQWGITKNKYAEKVLTNEAKVLDESNKEAAKHASEVKFTPEWISKNASEANYDLITEQKERRNVLSWSIEINSHEKELHNVKITDALPEGLEFVKAKLQKWDGSKWADVKAIASEPSGSVYEIGNITEKHRLIIVSKVTEITEVPKIRSFKNTATLTSDEIKTPIASEKSAGTGINLLHKSAVEESGKKKKIVWEKDGLYVYWNIKLKLSDYGHANDFKIYDVFYYKHEISGGKRVPLDLNTLDNKDSLPPAVKNNLTAFSSEGRQATGQQYGDSFVGDTLNVQKYPLVKGGKEVGEIIEISGFNVQDKNYTMTFKSKVVDPTLVFPNTHGDLISNEIRNSAVLVDKNNKIVNDSTPRVFNKAGFLFKEAIDATKVKDDPADYVNAFFAEDTRSNGETKGYNHVDNSVIFRFSINPHQINMSKTEVLGPDGMIKAVGEVSVVDALPKGWEVVEIVPGKQYVVFEGDKTESSLRSKVTKLTPIEPVSIEFDESMHKDPVAPKLTFKFTKDLDKSYVILVKARPSDEIRKDYNNKEVIEGVEYKDGKAKSTNKLTIKSESWTGLDQFQSIKVPNEPLAKQAKYLGNGAIQWAIDYKGMGINYSDNGQNPKLVDTLPEGLSLALDDNGKPKIGPGYIEIIEWNTTADGKFTLGNPVQNAEDFVNYDTNKDGKQEIAFTIPDIKKNYHIRYVTDVFGKVGEITNEVSLKGGDKSPAEPTRAKFQVQDDYVKATLEKLASFKIKKISSSDIPPIALEGAKFELRSKAGTVIRSGDTGADGMLAFQFLGEGAYELVETKAPNGYALKTQKYAVLVEKISGSTTNKLRVLIDGQAIGDNVFEITNDKSVPGGGNPPGGSNPPSPVRPGDKIEDNQTPKSQPEDPKKQDQDHNKTNDPKDQGAKEDNISDNSVPKANAKDEVKKQNIAGAPKTGIGMFEYQGALFAGAILLAVIFLGKKFFRKDH